MGDISFNIVKLSFAILLSTYILHGPSISHLKIKTICPYNIGSVKCGHQLNTIEFNSVQIMQYVSYCEKHTFDEQCTELIQQKINVSCNGYNTCKPNIWTKSAGTWDNCIRIPKFVNISFSCKAISTLIPLTDESSTEGNIGVAVGVIVGLIVIVGVVVLYLLLVRRKNTDDKHDIAGQHNISDYVGNQNIALPANCNSEISTNLELKSIDRKQINKSETVLEIGDRKDTDNQYYNTSNFSPALEPNRTGFPVQHSNAYDYEMAKPINDSKIYDKNITQAETDNYAFNEDQYDVAAKIDGTDYQQGIYSRAVDTVYDSASHSRQSTVTDETYDHALGQTTEDDYDIAKH